MKKMMDKKSGATVEKFSIFLLLVSTVFVFGVDMVSAQENVEEQKELQNVEKLTPEEMKARGIPQGGIQISPTKFVWTLEPGEEKNGRVILKNYSEQEQRVTMEVEDFFVKEDGSTPQLYVPDENHPLKAYDVINWFTPPDSVLIPAGGARVVEFSVRVPEDQPTNGYYGSLLFRTGGGSEEDEGSKIGLSYRIGSLVIMAVQGDEPMNVDGEVQDFYPEKKVFWDTPAVLFARLNNTGNIHFPVFGNIEVKKFGKKFHEIEMTPRLLYPTADPVDFREIMETSIWDFGIYTADLTMNSEGDHLKFEKSTTFYVIPWKGLAIIFGGLFGLIILKKMIGSQFHIERKKKKRKRMK